MGIDLVVALQPSLRTHCHWAEFVPKLAVSATEDWLVRWHQVAVDLNRLLAFGGRFRRSA